MIVTALRATGDGGCSTPAQIRAQLSDKEEEEGSVLRGHRHSSVPQWMLERRYNWVLVAAGESLCPPGSGWGPHATRVESSWLPHLPLLQVLPGRGGEKLWGRDGPWGTCQQQYPGGKPVHVHHLHGWTLYPPWSSGHSAAAAIDKVITAPQGHISLQGRIK